jgi:HEAT repeat protein
MMRRTHEANNQTVEGLVAQLGAPQQFVRLQAAAKLGALGKSSATVVEALSRVLQAGCPLSRKTAALALGDIGPRAAAAVPALVAALDDEDAGVARRAVRALGSLGAAGELRRALGHSSPGVRDMAALALAELERPPARAV